VVWQAQILAFGFWPRSPVHQGSRFVLGFGCSALQLSDCVRVLFAADQILSSACSLRSRSSVRPCPAVYSSPLARSTPGRSSARARFVLAVDFPARKARTAKRFLAAESCLPARTCH
jgi:hypothetical protein